MESARTEAAASEPASNEPVPVVSSILSDGRLIELVYDREARATRLAVGDRDGWQLVESIAAAGGEELVPYSASNSLIKNGIVLFPSEATDYGSIEELVAAVREYLHRYVDLSERFERLTAHYVLLTWIYDCFNELPYLRLRGDYGTGKTRFLLTLGSICYKPMFASGASTVSPLFHMLDRFGGTLVIDEADFRFSDEKSDLAKILNNGNVRGFPVLRQETKNGKEFNPRAFQVFGPKVIAMRHHYGDAALESRFITETSGGRALRKGIPINLPAAQRQEAQALRNKLLQYRFRKFKEVNATPEMLDPALEPRINQIFSPLAAVMEEEGARAELRALARQSAALLKADRGASLEAQVLTVIRLVLERSEQPSIAISDILAAFRRAYGAECERPMTSRLLGEVIRRRLNLISYKSHGVFVIPVSERGKLEALFERYGITSEDAMAIASAEKESAAQAAAGADSGAFRDVGMAPEGEREAGQQSEGPVEG